MKTAIFGGTFDPVHEGHLAAAGAAADRWGLDRILFVPASRPPHKLGSTAASYEHRFRMVELACAADARFTASRLEAGEEYSYSIDTIEKVRAAQPAGSALYFLIGADAFAEIESWRRWRDVLASVEFLVVSRPGHVYHSPEGARVHRLDALDMDVSSSAIRARLAAGEAAAGTPGAVLEYIRVHGLYS